MAGFIRRFGYFPGVDVIRQIEGVVIVDLPPPASINGVGTGTCAHVGEFADATYAVTASSSGVLTANPVPVEVYGSQDFINKAGGFDASIGNFGSAEGNGFCTLRSKRFSRLVVVPIDNITPSSGSAYGIRVWRQLPTNQSTTSPQPIVPVAGGTVLAGREFKSGSNRVRCAKTFTFADTLAFASGVDGVVTPAGLPAATQIFNSPGATFQTSGVQVGDLLVLGVLGGAGAYGTDARTFRVVTVTDQNNLVIQEMNGVNFTVGTWVVGATLPWRIHTGACGDTSALVAELHLALSGAGGSVVPARPVDATVAAATELTPTVVPTAGSANTWDVLSGLTAMTHPTGALTYDALIHGVAGVGPANNSTLDARYQSAIDALLQDAAPARDVNLVFSSRKSSTIRSKLATHCSVARSRGLTRTCQVSPQLVTQTVNGAIAGTDPGVGANRADYVDYSWPGCQISVPEAVGTSLATADGKMTTDGLLDNSMDGWLSAILSNLPPERNPGEATPITQGVLSPILGFQRGAPKLDITSYTALRQNGIAALRLDRTVGPIIQSGVTTSLISGEQNISRRRMADYIQDSIAQAIVPFSKQLLTSQLTDSIIAEVHAFLNGLQSPNNPAAQRITDYSVDSVSGNTPQTLAQGIFVLIVRVRLTPTANFIVVQTDISENTEIIQQIAA